ALERVLAELPPLSRAIFVAAVVEEQPYRAIAARFGMSLRSVEREMRRVLDHCGKRLDKKLANRAGRTPRETSKKEALPMETPARSMMADSENSAEPPPKPPDDLLREAQRWVLRLHSGRVSREEIDAIARWRGATQAHRRAFAEASLRWDVARRAARNL